MQECQPKSWDTNIHLYLTNVFEWHLIRVGSNHFVIEFLCQLSLISYYKYLGSIGGYDATNRTTPPRVYIGTSGSKSGCRMFCIPHCPWAVCKLKWSCFYAIWYYRFACSLVFIIITFMSNTTRTLLHLFYQILLTVLQVYKQWILTRVSQCIHHLQNITAYHHGQTISWFLGLHTDTNTAKPNWWLFQNQIRY